MIDALFYWSNFSSKLLLRDDDMVDKGNYVNDGACLRGNDIALVAALVGTREVSSLATIVLKTK